MSKTQADSELESKGDVLHEALQTILAIDRQHDLSLYVGRGSGGNFSDALLLRSALEAVREHLVLNAPQMFLPARPNAPDHPIYHEPKQR